VLVLSTSRSSKIGLHTRDIPFRSRAVSSSRPGYASAAFMPVTQEAASSSPVAPASSLIKAYLSQVQPHNHPMRDVPGRVCSGGRTQHHEFSHRFQVRMIFLKPMLRRISGGRVPDTHHSYAAATTGFAAVFPGKRRALLKSNLCRPRRRLHNNCCIRRTTSTRPYCGLGEIVLQAVMKSTEHLMLHHRNLISLQD
jgi:hypothetical protein